MGARYGYLSSLTKDEWTKLQSNGIKVGAAASFSYAGFGGGVKAGTAVEKEQAEAFSKAKNGSKTFSLGKSPPANGGDNTAWARDAETEPMPIKYSLKPISDLFDKNSAYVKDLPQKDWGRIQANIKQGLFDYCVRLKEKGKLTSCDKPGADKELAKPSLAGSCRLCGSCGGDWSSERGGMGVHQDHWDYFIHYGKNCGESLAARSLQQGVKICCKPESSTINSSCKQCTKCGNGFNIAGKISGDGDYKDFFNSFDNDCNGDSRQRGLATNEFCCKSFNNKPLCSFCMTCGGIWKTETGVMDTKNPGVYNYFTARSLSCAGELNTVPKNSAIKGIALCCQ